MFEIIYPQDKHIVNYNDTDDIFLLAVISIKNNFEYQPEIFDNLFPVVKKYHVADWRECRGIINDNTREGFVVKIGPVRVKMKYKEYWRLYSLKSGLTEKFIYQCLVNEDLSPVYEALKLFDEEQTIYYTDIIKKYSHTILNNKFIGVPYKNCHGEDIIYMDQRIVTFLSGSSGMSAGNTFYEAYI